MQLIECVPNFSEGQNIAVINAITDQIKSVKGVQLLHVDIGEGANRTVVTFVGTSDAVVEAAFLAIQTAGERIDMRQQTGTHPRMGATDVCPLIPLANISMEEVAQYAHQLAQRVGEQLNIPCFMYEQAATHPKRENLANIRAGEYEGMAIKMQQPDWQPDYGNGFNAQTGATAIGARDFLIAYNINLNTNTVKTATAIARDVRESGRMVTDENGNKVRQHGTCKGLKAIGWYIEEYGIAQVSMNITNRQATPMHIAFEEVRKSANRRGVQVTGSELVGLVPLQAILEAGRYFLQQKRQQQDQATTIAEATIIESAIQGLGLDELAPFEPQERIIEYMLQW